METNEEVVGEQNAQSGAVVGMQIVPYQGEIVDKKRQRINKLIAHQSIKYSGVFSHKMVKAMGFLLMFLAQLAVAIHIMVACKEDMPGWTGKMADVFEIMSFFALPMFLTANFCVIMTSQEKIKKRMITYGVIALGIYLAILFVFYRYVLGLGHALNPGDSGAAYKFADSFAKSVFGKVINYNVFVDLFFFSLFYYFLFYKPKKIKKKSTMKVFRWLSIIPPLIAICSTVLYGFYNQAIIDLPVAALSILPCRSIFFYFIFFSIAIVIKIRQVVFIKWGGTQTEYKQYAASNRSSLEMSVLVSIIILLACVVDLVLLYISPYLVFYGVGFNFFFVVTIPFIFLLSYTKKVKKGYWDIIMIATFIIATIILYLETALFILK